MAYVTYPKLRVEFMLSLDESHKETWRQQWFDIHGGLIDSVRRRAHPVTQLHIGTYSWLSVGQASMHL